MVSSRTTKPIIFRLDSRALRIWVGSLIALGVCGCGTSTPPPSDSSQTSPSTPIPGMNDPSWLTTREKLPPPDTDRIEYDTDKRTLTLYELPTPDSWMVQLPEETAGRLVGPQHQLPMGVDITRTLVYYARAGMKVSAPVTVAQIKAGHLTHPSLGE
jgi:cholesterol transport system auxiliary component